MGAMAAAAIIGVVLLRPDVSPPVIDVAETIEERPTTSPLPTDGADGPQPSRSEQPSVTSGLPAPPEPGSQPTLPAQGANDGAGSPTSAPTSAPTSPPIRPGPFEASRDLLSLHYDYLHLDDGHATVAALEIATEFEAATHVVGGTRGVASTSWFHPFEAVMQATWGDAWLDAKADWVGSVNRSAERWLATIDAGGRVWVAEGGASDFTAEVVREIQRQRPALDTRVTIHVIQHSDRNEAEARPENLRFVQANTAYERIDDGNEANGTADLNQPSEEFTRAALAGRHGSAWATAFDYYPATELDFSDTVEVLHIVGVDIDEVADPSDFARRFLS